MRALRSIQVLRGIAACTIVLHHALQSAGCNYAIGGARVDLFFVISGFIMASIPKRPSFLVDRFWRIYPLWLIAVTPWILWVHPDWPRLATSLTFWPIIGTWQIPALRVGWTLSFEMLFYFAVAAWMRVGMKPLLILFAAMLGGAAFIRWPIFNYLGNPMTFEFLAGVAIANLPKRAALALPLLAAAAIGLAFAPSWVGNDDLALRIAAAWRVLYLGVPAAMIVYACVSAERAFAPRYWAPALMLGNASYSIYLFHPAFIELPLWWPLKTVLGIAGGIAVWWLIERRVIAFYKSRRTVTAQPAAA